MQNRSHRITRIVAMALVLAVMSSTLVSCYGRFPLTRAVYRFNGDISGDRIIRSVVLWAFVIIPVYGIAMLGDALIFNLVQFWTGETLHVGSTTEKDGIKSTFMPVGDGKEAILTLSRDGQVLRQERFIRVSDQKVEVRDMKGKLDGMVIRNEKGDLQLMDAKGTVIRTLPSEALKGI